MDHRPVVAQEEAAPRIERPLRVLVVDDDKVDRINARRSLRAASLQVDVAEAESCAAARDMLASGGFDCVFLDYLLPDGNGLDVVREVRACGVRTPVVVLTGQGDEQVAVELMKAGAADYLPKALATPERIAQCLRNVVRVFRAERSALDAERERERALELERLARDAAEAAQRRLAFLAEASALVSSSLDYEETLENVARLPVPAFADWTFVDLVEPDGGHVRSAVAHRDPAAAPIAKRLRRRYAGMPDAPHGTSRVIATGRSEVVNDVPAWLLVAVARDAEHLEALRAVGVRAAMTVPLVARGRTLGAMTLIKCGASSRYTVDDLAFAEELARRAALAVDNARLFADVKDAEARLRHQLDFTTAITGSLAEGVCALDREGRFAFVNPAAESILGYAAEDLLSRRLGETIRPTATALLRATREGALLRADEEYFQRKDGSTVIVSLVASPILSEGRVAGAVIAFHDATRRKRAEAELEASRRVLAQSEKLSALGTLVSGVAHELRTPLTYLTNNLFLLQARLDAAAREDHRVAPLVADVHRFAQAALDGVDRINALVRDLRPFANPEGGRRIEAGVHEVVSGAVDLFRATQRGRVEVVASLDPTPPVLVDKGQFQRVVINLLVNAAEAMPHGGRIWVRTRAVGTLALLEVQDEGGGIPPEVEARIFDPFFTTKTEGTGLGLAITRRIVESHGGVIAYRTAANAGTTFSITLPTEQTSTVVRAAPAPSRS